MNVIAWLEYELAYYDSAVHRFYHYTTRTPPPEFPASISWMYRLLWDYVFCDNILWNNILPKSISRWIRISINKKEIVCIKKNGNILVAFYINNNWLIGLVERVFANGPRDLGSIPDRVIPKMVFDTSLLNTQQCKVRIKSKVEQSRERSNARPYKSL